MTSTLLCNAQAFPLQSEIKAFEIVPVLRMELELGRELDADWKRIPQEASVVAADAEWLKVAEQEQTISDLQQQIGMPKPEAGQGPMQLQGEVLGIQLKALFPHGVNDPDAKGARLADNCQEMCTRTEQQRGAQSCYHLEAVVNSFVAMQEEVFMEERGMEKIWSAWTVQLDRATDMRLHFAREFKGLFSRPRCRNSRHYNWKQ